ncbi:unnamed protein product [Arabis nemorensis]|uniref:Uncharacterized protein n=1 Tax=Arabis nemorensis TaxID=586526 RepID=A0A565B1G4_9BRAS|nr:unnamed protein product [Arabis nemorensis]
MCLSLIVYPKTPSFYFSLPHFTLVSDYKLGIRHLLLLCLVVFINGLPCLGHENMFDVKALYVGNESCKETLPLQSGSRVYKLERLKSNSWYEVKISYPASIPARFSLQLLKNSEMVVLKLNQMRRLLDTKKLIFKAESTLQELTIRLDCMFWLPWNPRGSWQYRIRKKDLSSFTT